MIIDSVSDLHGYEPELEGGDLLILAGDYTASDHIKQWASFFAWLKKQKYRKKILVAGNHDNFLSKGFPKTQKEADELKEVQEYINFKPDFEYLCDSGTEFEDLKIWGTPWSLWFDGINPHCKAFTGSENDLSKKYALIPDNTDILISHGPAYGILDQTKRGECVGSKSLQMELFNRLNPKLFVCAHIHEAHGIEPKGGFVENAINCSYVDGDYEPVNKPIRVIL